MRAPTLLVLVTLALSASCLLAPDAEADGFLVPTRPRQPIRGQWAVSYHKVDMLVRGPHVRVTVDQEFVNLGGTTLEAEYVFPLPRGAMVSSVTLFENGKGLEGRILRAEEARRIFEEIVRRQKDPALLEYLGHDFFRVRVFPIPAGQRRRVVLKYDQLLTQDAASFELVYPLNTEKFSARPLDTVVVTADIEAAAPLGPIYSPSHDIAVVRKGENAAVVSYEATNTTPAEDFLLYWSTTRNPVGANLLTYWPQGEGQGYFLFLASPTLGDAESTSRPKQVTFVVDTSGSMAGDKIEQAQAALRQVIGGLNPGDRFNVIAYHTTVIPLWPGVRDVDGPRTKEAFEFVALARPAGRTSRRPYRRPVRRPGRRHGQRAPLPHRRPSDDGHHRDRRDPPGGEQSQSEGGARASSSSASASTSTPSCSTGSPSRTAARRPSCVPTRTSSRRSPRSTRRSATPS